MIFLKKFYLSLAFVAGMLEKWTFCQNRSCPSCT